MRRVRGMGQAIGWPVALCGKCGSAAWAGEAVLYLLPNRWIGALEHRTEVELPRVPPRLGAQLWDEVGWALHRMGPHARRHAARRELAQPPPRVLVVDRHLQLPYGASERCHMGQVRDALWGK